jgi:tRNA (guanine-N7-)-methyltransferase
VIRAPFDAIVENPQRTHRFLAAIQERKTKLQTSLAELFPRPQKFVCEFGCGHGHFLVAYAQAHPATLCLGLDLEADRIARATRKQQRAQAAHLHFLHADAHLFLEALPAGATFTSVFILFPDPWPKQRHHKHRLIQPEFLDRLRQHSTDETRLYFRTDYQPYFAAAAAMIRQHPGWETTEGPWPFEHESVFQSRATAYHSFIARPGAPAP